MLFNSYEFLLIYLPITLLGYFLLGKYARSVHAISWLSAASLVFYAWWDSRYLILLLSSIGFNFSLGRALGKSEHITATDRLLLGFGITCNLILLGYFKYAVFFVRNVSALTGGDFNLGEIVLPLGISFFTFTQIAYLVDAYRKEVRDFGVSRYLLFVTFFPHLIAGPVLHHAEIMPQFRREAAFRPQAENFAVGLSIFAIGLFKKVIIADGVALYATPVFAAAAAGEPLGGVAAWAGALAYTFQIYFDFSGYSDMAIGLARLFGITFPANFNSPYKARSIIDFWRRWHMTLSRFLRDYLYIPLGGSRCSPVRRQFNLLITMLLGGLWHGAGWTFIIWGGLHGGYLVINHLWREVCARLPKIPRPFSDAGRIFTALLTFLCVVVAWVFFRADSVDAAMGMLRSMLGQHGFAYKTEYFRGASEVKNLLVCGAIAWLLPNVQELMGRYKAALEIYGESRLSRRLAWQPDSAYWAVFIGGLGAVAVLNISELSEFLYFQF